MESDGGSDGQASDTGVVPSEETSSWVNGWCSKNLDTSSKLQRTRRKHTIQAQLERNLKQAKQALTHILSH